MFTKDQMRLYVLHRITEFVGANRSEILESELFSNEEYEQVEKAFSEVVDILIPDEVELQPILDELYQE
jgi:hypothetical protein